MKRLCCATVIVGLFANLAFAAEPAFPPALKLKGKIEKAANDKPPEFGYVSGSAGGAFTLAKQVGHAQFRWNHGLDVDWHDHSTVYAGQASDDQNNKYWVYTLTYLHEGHYDKVWVFFAQTEVPDDTGFRIFFGHADYAQGQPEPPVPEEHDIHVWCVDAVRFGSHEDHGPESIARPKSKFRMMGGK